MSTDPIDRSQKILLNKRVTSEDKAIYEEVGAETVNISFSEMWTGTIVQNDPGVTEVLGNAVFYDKITFIEDSSVSDSQSWYLSETGSAGAARLVDWISDKFGADFEGMLFDNNDNQIFPTDALDWFFDYKTGILTINGNVSGYATPFKWSGYRYEGPKGEIGDLFDDRNVTPIGAVIAWFPNLLAEAGRSIELPNGYLRCDGQFVDNPFSPLFGVQLPDLNNATGVLDRADGGVFLRGSDDNASTGELGQIFEDQIRDHNHYPNPPYDGTEHLEGLFDVTAGADTDIALMGGGRTSTVPSGNYDSGPFPVDGFTGPQVVNPDYDPSDPSSPQYLDASGASETVPVYAKCVWIIRVVSETNPQSVEIESDYLQWEVQPTDAIEDDLISPSPQITLRKADTSIELNDYITKVTVGIRTNTGASPAEGEVSGVITKQAVAGVVTFDELSVSDIENDLIDVRLLAVADDPDITTALSDPFDVFAEPTYHESLAVEGYSTPEFGDFESNTCRAGWLYGFDEDLTEQFVIDYWGRDPLLGAPNGDSLDFSFLFTEFPGPSKPVKKGNWYSMDRVQPYEVTHPTASPPKWTQNINCPVSGNRVIYEFVFRLNDKDSPDATIEELIRPNSGGQPYYRLGFYVSGAGNTVLSCWGSTSGLDYDLGKSIIGTGEWQYVALTSNGSPQEFWLNGVKVNTSNTNSFTSGSAPTSIGNVNVDWDIAHFSAAWHGPYNVANQKLNRDAIVAVKGISADMAPWLGP